ncbi:hypothetical protein MPTK2_1g18330 [Marchantia polymorpha subsp. ruderalis]
MPINGRETGQPPQVGRRLMAKPELVTAPAQPVLEAVGARPNLDHYRKLVMPLWYLELRDHVSPERILKAKRSVVYVLTELAQQGCLQNQPPWHLDSQLAGMYLVVGQTH